MDLKDNIVKFKDVVLKKYWNDPVWSKVISAIIIAVGTTLIIAIKSIYKKISFLSVAEHFFEYLLSTTEINNLIIWISLFIICWSLYFFIKAVFLKIKATKRETKSDEVKELPIIYDHSTVFFSYRLASAFPGQRGLKWYDSKTAVNRLEIVFQDPIDFKANINSQYVTDPIWWFRGHRAMFIKKFKKISKTKILLGHDELEINRIAVYIGDSYYECFIYFEIKGEKQTGLYNRTDEDIEETKNRRGYDNEEYALFGRKPISREQYDDGATIINGKVVEAFGAKLRVRYLTNYNFILAAKESPYNSRKFDRESNDYFNKILKAEITPETFFDYLNTFTKNED